MGLLDFCSATLLCKIGSLPFLGLRPLPSNPAQSKERKGSNYAIWPPWPLAVVLMVMVTWRILNREDSGGSFSKTLLHIVGNSLNQPLNSALWPRKTTGQAVIIFFSLYNLTICVMYSSVVISILNATQEPTGINALSDLNRGENMHVRIFMKNLSYVPGYLKSSQMLDGFEHRVDYINPPTRDKGSYLEDILKSVLNGSYVYISSEANFNAIICPVNEEANKTVFRKNEFRRSR